MIEVKIRLGWEADSLSHDGWQYEADGEGCFILPREVYFELRDRGVEMTYIEENEAEEPSDSEASGSGTAPLGEGVDSSAPSPKEPVTEASGETEEPEADPEPEVPVVETPVDIVTNAPPLEEKAEKPPKAAK